MQDTTGCAVNVDILLKDASLQTPRIISACKRTQRNLHPGILPYQALTDIEACEVVQSPMEVQEVDCVIYLSSPDCAEIWKNTSVSCTKYFKVGCFLPYIWRNSCYMIAGHVESFHIGCILVTEHTAVHMDKVNFRNVLSCIAVQSTWGSHSISEQIYLSSCPQDGFAHESQNYPYFRERDLAPPEPCHCIDRLIPQEPMRCHSARCIPLLHTHHRALYPTILKIVLPVPVYGTPVCL